MPELPEVETVRRGLAPHLLQRRLLGARVREKRLRWPVPDNLDELVRGQLVVALTRRGKYLLIQLQRDAGHGTLIVHLGMSGSLRLTPAEQAAEKHDHLDLLLEDGRCLRLRDPRRFGAVLWSDEPSRHPLLVHLGVEPLSAAFNGDALYTLSRKRKTAIKTLLMDARHVVGIGNIYANEALFHAGIDPRMAAGRLTRSRCAKLANAIQDTLTRAIAAGGSTLRDFVDGHGQPGYFQQTYAVYGRGAEPCRACGRPIAHLVQGARSTFFCPACQKR